VNIVCQGVQGGRLQYSAISHDITVHGVRHIISTYGYHFCFVVAEQTPCVSFAYYQMHFDAGSYLSRYANLNVPCVRNTDRKSYVASRVVQQESAAQADLHTCSRDTNPIGSET